MCIHVYICIERERARDSTIPSYILSLGIYAAYDSTATSGIWDYLVLVIMEATEVHGLRNGILNSLPVCSCND